MGAGSWGTFHDSQLWQSGQGRKFISRPLCLLVPPPSRPHLISCRLASPEVSHRPCHPTPRLGKLKWWGLSDILAHQRRYMLVQARVQRCLHPKSPSPVPSSPLVASEWPLIEMPYSLPLGRGDKGPNWVIRKRKKKKIGSGLNLTTNLLCDSG